MGYLSYDSSRLLALKVIRAARYALSLRKLSAVDNLAMREMIYAQQQRLVWLRHMHYGEGH